MIIRKFLLVATALSISHFAFGQDLLGNALQEWTLGPISNTDSFSDFGGINEIVSIDGPYDNGAPVNAWRARPDAVAGGSGASGGFLYKGIVLNTSRTYRVTYWMRSTGNSNCGNNAAIILKGADGTGPNIEAITVENGSLRAWPTIMDTDLANDKWYLVVGYIYGSGANSFNLPSGVYDPDTFDESDPTTLPAPIESVLNYQFPASYSELTLKLRNTLWDCAVGDTQYSYLPTLEEANAQMTPLTHILNPRNAGTGQGNTGRGSTVWSQSGTDIHYNGGNVGIGTTDPGTWKLAVNGKIRTKEIKVETSWADYVFAKDYDLPSLREVEEHIREKGHLMNIPSAEEVAANGIQLGEMNKLLLEKIEELTLYILQQDKAQRLQEKRIQELKKQLEQLKANK